jgi:hypothetical protein
MEYKEICEEFFKLLKNYTNVFYKNLLVRHISNRNYLDMLYIKGLFLLKNIYSLLFFYCENINEIILMSEKSYIYYIEFLIQINLNSTNLELTVRDALLFTYKKTLLSYNKQHTNSPIKRKINKEVDTYLNILCNIFHLIDNINFIDYDIESSISNIGYINSFVIKKINKIEELENKLKNYTIDNINLSELNNILLQLRDNIENNIENKLQNIINNKIHYMLSNY